MEKPNFKWYTTYDGINALVYIIDPQTHEILYANTKMKEALGDVVGKSCYMAVAGCEVPCKGCVSLDDLTQKGGNRESKWIYNKLLKEYVDIQEKVVEWDDGREVRFCIITSVAEA